MRREQALGYIWISAMLTRAEAVQFYAEVYLLEDLSTAAVRIYLITTNNLKLN